MKNENTTESMSTIGFVVMSDRFNLHSPFFILHYSLFTAPRHRSPQSSTFLSRSALTITETELNVIAALAIMGFKSSSKNG